MALPDSTFALVALIVVFVPLTHWSPSESASPGCRVIEYTSGVADDTGGLAVARSTTA